MFKLRCGLCKQDRRVFARKKFISDNKFRQRFKSSGFSFLEVLLSLAIFSVGMLGFAHVQIFNVRLANESLINFRASLLMESAREQILAAGELVDEERWRAKIESSLPEGKMDVSNASGIFELGISWEPLFDRGGTSISKQIPAKLVNKDG